MLVAKLKAARHMRAILVTTPPYLKSFILKFVEICHNLNRVSDMKNEKLESRNTKNILSGLKKLKFNPLNILSSGGQSCGELSAGEITSLKEQAALCLEIFDIFKSSVEIMDEVDLILHPLKSELNWPLGEKQPLDFTKSLAGTGLRWNVPSYLLDAIFSSCGMPIMADIADSKAAGKAL